MLTSNNEIKWQVVFNMNLGWEYKTKQIKKKNQENVIKQPLKTLDNLFLPHSRKGKENKAELPTADLRQQSQNTRNNYHESNHITT